MASVEHDALVQLVRAGTSLTPEPASVEALRATFGKSFSQTLQGFPIAPGTLIEPIYPGGVPALSVVSEGASSDRTILYLHGSGYCFGSPYAFREFACRLSTAANANVVVADYRLAPEHPFPAAIVDTLAVYRWILGNIGRPETTFIAGDAAGGGLALAALMALRNRHEPLPAGAVFLSPWVDLGLTGDSHAKHANEDPIFPGKRGQAMLTMLAEAYLNGTDPATAPASPLFADFHGLPPLRVFVGSKEVLLDDAMRLAQRAVQEGVEVQMTVEDGLLHTWQLFPVLPEAAVTVAQIGEFVSHHINLQSKPAALPAHVPAAPAPFPLSPM